MKIIALSGKKGVGKSTLAKMLVHRHGFEAVSFADPLKQMLCQMFGLKREMFERPELKEQVIPGLGQWTPRLLMMEFGEFYKRFDPDFWVKKVFADMNYARDLFRKDKFVVVDTRFVVEAEALKKQGAVLVRLNRPAALNPYKASPLNKDRTECDLDSYTGWDYVIASNANKTLSDLEAVAEMLIKKELMNEKV